MNRPIGSAEKNQFTFFFFFPLGKYLPQGQIARILYSGISFQNITFCYCTFFLTGLINFIKRWSNTDHIRGLVLISSLKLVLLSWAQCLPQRKKRKTIKDSLRRPHLSAEDLGERSYSHAVTVKCLLRVLLSHSTALGFYYFLLLGPRFKGNSKGRNETVLISLCI